jgi:hypothetical protein
MKANHATPFICAVLTGAGIAVTAPAVATDLAWHSTGGPAVRFAMNFERKGTVDFKGEQGSFVAYGTDLPQTSALMPYVVVYVFRFDDISSITVRTNGEFDPGTKTSKVSGEILSGTGRFVGIRGKVAAINRITGDILETDWTGSYSLPKKSP